MQEKPKGNSNLIILAVIVVAIGVAGYFYIGRDQSTDATLTITKGSPASLDDNQLLAALRDLKRHNLDNSLFSDPLWLSLTDFSKPLVLQEPGRPNPFAPFNSTNSTASSTPKQ